MTRAKTQSDKTLDLNSALDLLPEGNFSIGFGGVTLYRRPMAFALACLDRHQKTGHPNNLTLINFTAGVESDILVGQGMVSRLRTCYFGLEIFGLAPNFVSAAGSGQIEVIEETEASLAFGLRAAMAGVGFMPSTAWIGTDLPKLRPDVKTVVDPYSGEELTAFPAIHTDVAVIHALRADPRGNADIGTNLGVDRELALTSECVIVTTEEIVPSLDKADILGPLVDTVVHAPRGAWPTSCHPNYPLDGEAVLAYSETAGGEGYDVLLRSWMDAHNL
ncbi:MAG: CoA-transferase [Anaerolineales bacterium]|jgi:glutaconate CoA-transferase subunit A